MKNVLHDIVEIRTLRKGSGRDTPDSVINELLSGGWILLGMYTTCYDHISFPNEQNAHIILGRPSSVSSDRPEEEGTDR